MKVGNIVKPNSKGQIVIPKKVRDGLNIGQNTLLNLTVVGKGIYLEPLSEALGLTTNKELFLDILKKTQGAWHKDSWDQTAKKRASIELKASQKRKKAW